jgi:beta-glucosidase
MNTRSYFLGLTLLAGALLSTAAIAQNHAQKEQRPWMNCSLTPEERADLVLKEMTLDEKISLLHGNGMPHWPKSMPLLWQSNGGAGYVVGIPRLGIPPIQMSDAAYGVRASGENGKYSTALPSNLGSASSWDLEGAYQYGALIGRELRAQGYNMSLGGGVNLTREPRNGRTFEYLGEDPLLAGKMVGQVMKGLQAQHVIGDIKHYAVNDQETGRNIVNSVISKRALREGDLLAFEIGLRDSNAVAFMCSYNRVNGDHACENSYLLTDVLKHDWKFKGFVLSDWGGTHSTVKASSAGLDHEEPLADFYGDAMRKAVEDGRVPMSEIDDHARRILWAEFASGIVDDPIQKSVVNVWGGLEIAQRLAEQSIVLLKNENGQLPLKASNLHKVAIIGPHADVGMISGGGSAQVDPPGGNAIMPPGKGATTWQAHIWFPTSPLKTLKAKLPTTQVEFNSGTDPAAAATLAKSSDVAIVFAYQWESEGMDLPNLSLPENQDQLIEQVAAANPHTIVVLETGGPVTMPWADKVSGIVEAWYAGSSGSEAVANILLGQVNPSGKLAVTFPKSENDLPRPQITHPSESERNEGTAAVNTSTNTASTYAVHYDEGLKVGYKWYDAEKKPILFPFGYGLSYTTYAYSGLKITPAPNVAVSFTIKNTGKRAGAEIAQVYAFMPASTGEPPKRLIGWDKVKLGPGESRDVSISIDPQYLSVFDENKDQWILSPGEYTIAVGGSSQDLGLKQNLSVH